MVPELARNAPDSYGKLEKKKGFVRMIDELLTARCENGVIRVAKVGNVVLAAHSGAYRKVAGFSPKVTSAQYHGSLAFRRSLCAHGLV